MPQGAERFVDVLRQRLGDESLPPHRKIEQHPDVGAPVLLKELVDIIRLDDVRVLCEIAD